MTAKVQNRSPYLRTSRNFPQDPQALSVELEKSYIDIANNVNSRTIGTYATSPNITGNTWFTAGDSTKQQTIRQVYLITGAGSYPHGITVANIGGFVSIQGTFTDGSIWYPLPYVNVVAANNQVSVTVTSTNIVVTVGGGAPPTIVSGFIVLEWISNP